MPAFRISQILILFLMISAGSCLPSANTKDYLMDLLSFNRISDAENSGSSLTPLIQAPVLYLSAGMESGSVQVSVSEVTDAEEYRIYYSTDPGVSSSNYTASQTFVGPSTVINGLKVQVPYYFAATAFSSTLGVSADSAVVTFTPVYTGSDSEPPIVSAVTMSPDTAGPGSEITLTINAEDALSGLSYFSANIYNNNTESVTSVMGQCSNLSGVCSANFTVSQYDPSGSYTADYIYVYDALGNSRYFYNSAGYYFDSTQGVDTVINVPVTTVAGTSPDYVPPVITGVSMSPVTGTIGTNVSITINAEDSQSGIYSMYADLKCTNISGSYWGLSFNGFCDETSGTCTASSVIEEFHPDGNCLLADIYVYDNEGNTLTFYQMNSGDTVYFNGYSGLLTDINIPAISVSGTNFDGEPPVLTSVYISSGNLTSGETLTVTAEGTDNLSGISDFTVNIYDSAFVDYYTVYGTCNSGICTGTLLIDSTVPVNTYYLDSLYLNDTAGNYSYYYNDSGYYTNGFTGFSTSVYVPFFSVY